MTSVTPRPRSLPRRLERWCVGFLMGVGAFFIEKLVMRSIRKGGGGPKPSEPSTMQSKGTTIEG